MSEQRTIEITDLYLEFDGMSFPILTVDLEYYMGQTPGAAVTVSSAINLDEVDAPLELLDNGIGNQASICMSINYHADTDEAHPGASHEKDLTLFCGYVISASPIFVCNAVSIAGARTIRLVSAVEALDTTPMGAMSYYGAESGIAGYTPMDYMLANSLVTAYHDFQLMPDEFNEDACGYLTRFLSAERRIIEKTLGSDGSEEGSPLTLESTILKIPARPTIQISKYCRLHEYLHTWLVSLFNNNSTTTVISEAAHNFFLEWIPETLSNDDTPCKMILFPVNAWDSNSYFTINPGDVLEVRETTNYKINSVVDCYAVSYNPSAHGTLQLSPLAIYGPSWRTASGEAIVLTSTDDLNRGAQEGQEDASRRRNNKEDNSSIFYVTMKNVSLPGWLSSVSVMTYGEVAATGGCPSIPKVSVNNNQDAVAETVEDWAKKVVKQVYCIKGLSQHVAQVRIPFWRWLTLLPYLGRVGTINIISTDSSKRRVDAFDLDTKTYYGILSGLSLTIRLDNKNITCQCAMQMSSLRDEEMQELMSCENPFYEWDPDALDWTLREATLLSDALLALEGKQWGTPRAGTEGGVDVGDITEDDSPSAELNDEASDLVND